MVLTKMVVVEQYETLLLLSTVKELSQALKETFMEEKFNKRAQ